MTIAKCPEHISISYYQVEILGGPDIYTHAGSPVQLECVVTNFVIPPMSVSWTHDGRLLDRTRYSGLAHKVDTKINMSSTLSMTDILTMFSSSVKIAMANSEDGGNYSCNPHKLEHYTVRLHVIDMYRLPMINSHQYHGGTLIGLFKYLVMVLILSEITFHV